MKIRPVRAESFHANVQTDRQTDRQTDMMKIIVPFRNYANAIKKGKVPVHIIKTYKGNRVTAPPILQLSTRWK